MTINRTTRRIALLALPLLCVASAAHANSLRAEGQAVAVAKSTVTITPQQNWNKLRKDLGKKTEIWTLDGDLLNNVTFYGGIDAGKPLEFELNKKRNPLPKFTETTLAAEIPELLEGTYRTQRKSGSFQVDSVQPGTFMGHNGVHFSYNYADEDQLVRKGEARAAIVGGKLYMITYEAPRLGYFERTLAAFRALADSARLQ